MDSHHAVSSYFSQDVHSGIKEEVFFQSLFKVQSILSYTLVAMSLGINEP